VCWNHPLCDILTSLLSNGLTLRAFHEYDYSPYNCFLKTAETSPGHYRIAHLDNKIPMVFALEAEKGG
jgi:hypothetical protein